MLRFHYQFIALQPERELIAIIRGHPKQSAVCLLECVYPEDKSHSLGEVPAIVAE